MEAAVAATLDAFGRIDVAFANAGFGAVRGFLNESPEHWRSMILTNVFGAAITIRATVQALEATGGHVLITGSARATSAIAGSVYSATKHAAVAMAESARKELRERGIRVTVISPGNVDTPFFDNAPQIHLTADDVARAVMFAVSQPPGVGINEILMRHPAKASRRLIRRPQHGSWDDPYAALSTALGRPMSHPAGGSNADGGWIYTPPPTRLLGRLIPTWAAYGSSCGRLKRYGGGSDGELFESSRVAFGEMGREGLVLPLQRVAVDGQVQLVEHDALPRPPALLP